MSDDDITPEKIAAAIEATGITHRGLVEALLERGNSAAEIAAMSPQQRLSEYLCWHGMPGWTNTILNIAEAAGFTLLVDGEPR